VDAEVQLGEPVLAENAVELEGVYARLLLLRVGPPRAVRGAVRRAVNNSGRILDGDEARQLRHDREGELAAGDQPVNLRSGRRGVLGEDGGVRRERGPVVVLARDVPEEPEPVLHERPAQRHAPWRVPRLHLVVVEVLAVLRPLVVVVPDVEGACELVPARLCDDVDDAAEARPNSAEYPEVWRETSWNASKFQLPANVCVTGSVVLTPSSIHEFSRMWSAENVRVPAGCDDTWACARMAW